MQNTVVEFRACMLGNAIRVENLVTDSRSPCSDDEVQPVCAINLSPDASMLWNFEILFVKMTCLFPYVYIHM